MKGHVVCKDEIGFDVSQETWLKTRLGFQDFGSASCIVNPFTSRYEACRTDEGHRLAPGIVVGSRDGFTGPHHAKLTLTLQQ